MMRGLSGARIAVGGIDMTMTTVRPIVTGLIGAIQSASAGISMTVSPPRQACTTNGRLAGNQRSSSAP